ncbi:MAG: DUF1810 domain-containing protein [Bacilli bacterium]|nr:DUF1810 domain-containing protein [Bacilli bacterium]
MQYPLDRFVKAHKRDFEIALEEIKNGRKESHWMWYIFPQLRGIGYSDYAEYYGLEGMEETKLFLEDEYLSNNLREITNVMLNLPLNDPSKILGSIDAMKLKSSMTLFYLVTNEELFKSVLNKFYKGEMCSITTSMLGK